MGGPASLLGPDVSLADRGLGSDLRTLGGPRPLEGAQSRIAVMRA